MYRICVCGSRNSKDANTVFDILSGMLSTYPPEEVVIIHGGAPGVDTFAGIWADDNDIKVEVFEADWETLGKSAGPIRNQAMYNSGIDVLMVFPGGKGTRSMLDICENGVYKPIIFDVLEYLQAMTGVDFGSFYCPYIPLTTTPVHGCHIDSPDNKVYTFINGRSESGN